MSRVQFRVPTGVEIVILTMLVPSYVSTIRVCIGVPGVPPVRLTVVVAA